MTNQSPSTKLPAEFEIVRKALQAIECLRNKEIVVTTDSFQEALQALDRLSSKYATAVENSLPKPPDGWEYFELKCPWNPDEGHQWYVHVYGGHRRGTVYGKAATLRNACLDALAKIKGES